MLKHYKEDETKGMSKTIAEDKEKSNKKIATKSDLKTTTKITPNSCRITRAKAKEIEKQKGGKIL
jgi:hypothetical protein